MGLKRNEKISFCFPAVFNLQGCGGLGLFLWRGGGLGQVGFQMGQNLEKLIKIQGEIVWSGKPETWDGAKGTLYFLGNPFPTRGISCIQVSHRRKTGLRSIT